MIDLRARAGRNGIGDGLRRAVARNPKKDALIFRDRTWSFEEMETAAFRIATHLRDAGLRKGDLVIGLDDSRVGSAESLVGLVHARKIGSEVSMTLIRDGERTTVDVTLGTAPTESG